MDLVMQHKAHMVRQYTFVQHIQEYAKSDFRFCPLKTLAIHSVKSSASLLSACLVSKLIGALKVQLYHIYLSCDAIVVILIKISPDKLEALFTYRANKINFCSSNYNPKHILCSHINKQISFLKEH